MVVNKTTESVWGSCPETENKRKGMSGSPISVSRSGSIHHSIENYIWLLTDIVPLNIIQTQNRVIFTN